MSIGVYKITNPIGQVYIGQSINIECRFSGHKSKIRLHRNKICESFILYGYENHIFEIIELCEKSKLNDRERFWQDHYKSYSECGLNMMKNKGNGLHGSHSKEAICKISNTKMGYKSKLKGKPSGRKGISVPKKSYSNPILDTFTGVYYINLREAADTYNINRDTLYKYLHSSKVFKRNNLNRLILA